MYYKLVSDLAQVLLSHLFLILNIYLKHEKLNNSSFCLSSFIYSLYERN
jgi:hypothetical protein